MLNLLLGYLRLISACPTKLKTLKAINVKKAHRQRQLSVDRVRKYADARTLLLYVIVIGGSIMAQIYKRYWLKNGLLTKKLY